MLWFRVEWPRDILKTKDWLASWWLRPEIERGLREEANLSSIRAARLGFRVCKGWSSRPSQVRLQALHFGMNCGKRNRFMAIDPAISLSVTAPPEAAAQGNRGVAAVKLHAGKCAYKYQRHRYFGLDFCIFTRFENAGVPAGQHSSERYRPRPHQMTISDGSAVRDRRYSCGPQMTFPGSLVWWPS